MDAWFFVSQSQSVLVILERKTACAFHDIMHLTILVSVRGIWRFQRKYMLYDSDRFECRFCDSFQPCVY